MNDERVQGCLLEFREPEGLLEAARSLRGQGYSLEAFTPFPLPELDDILPPTADPIPLIVLLGGLIGGLAGYGLQYFTAVIDYPYLVGGKPLHSWPAFIPVTFELIVLFAAFAAFLAALVSNALPRLHHPLFDIPDFDLASRDRFFLLAQAPEDFDPARCQRDFERTAALKISAYAPPPE